jgi:hypothetical protein
VPRALVIIALIAPLGVWLYFKASEPKPEPVPQIETVQVAPVQAASTPAVEAPPPAPAPTPAPALVTAPTQPLTPANPNDAGLNAVLEAGKK